MTSCFLLGRVHIGTFGSGSDAQGNREENAQVAIIRPGKNFPCVDKSRSISGPTSWNIGQSTAGTLLACAIGHPAPKTDQAADANLFRDGLRPSHKRHVAADRRLSRVRWRQRNHLARQQRGAEFSRLRQDDPDRTDARGYPEEPRDDRAAVRKALAGATASRESEDPADHAATASAKLGQDRPASKRRT